MMRVAIPAIIGAWLVVPTSIPARAQSTSAPVKFAGPAIETSGVAAVPGTSGALVVADGHERHVYWIDVPAAGRAAVRPAPIPLGIRLRDPEDITTDGTFFYAIGSQSKGGGRTAPGLVRFRFDAARRAVTGVESVSGLTQLLDAGVPEVARLRRARGGALDIEGLTVDRARGRLLLGLRSPMRAGRALVVSLRVTDAARPLAAANLTIDREPIALDLGGLAVRGLGYDAETDRVLIIAGASSDAAGGVSRLFEWDGAATSAPRVVAMLSAAEKPEGVTRFAIGGRSRTLVVFDAGAWQVID